MAIKFDGQLSAFVAIVIADLNLLVEANDMTAAKRSSVKRERFAALVMCSAAIGLSASIYRMIWAQPSVHAGTRSFSPDDCTAGGTTYPTGGTIGTPGNGSVCGSDGYWGPFNS